jgi:AbrB family looped-hinge helix DNA binding protein
MAAITVSSKYQIVIPRQIRNSLRIRPGQKLQVLQYRNRIEIVPLKPLRQMRGFLKGINTEIQREPDRV